MALNALGLGILFTAKDMATGVMKGVEKSFAQTRDEFGRFQKANKDLLGQWGVGVKAFGAGLLTMAAFTPAIMKSTEYEDALAGLRTVIDETAFSTERAKRVTKELAATYGGDAIAQAKSLHETISSGVENADDAIALVTSANRFAVAGRVQVEKSIDVLTSAVNVYRDSNLSAAEASDIMFTNILAGKSTADQLAHYLGEVAPTAQAAGVSFAELNAAIATLTVQGIRTPQAVTGLNAMLSNLIKPSKDASDEARRLGIQFDATALKTMGLKGVMMQLVGNSKMTDATMGKLFGSIDGIKAALALVSGGAAKFNDVLGQMQHSTGATDKAFNIMSRTTAFQVQRFKALGTNALIIIGDAIEPLRVAVLSFVNSLLDGFAKIPEPIINFMVRATAAAGVVIALVGAVTMLRTGLVLGAHAIRAFGLASSGGIVAALGPAIVIIGAVALAVAGMRYAIENNLGGIADRVGGGIGQIKLAFEALGQLFTQGGFSGHVRDAFLEGGNPAITFATQVYVTVSRVKAALEGLKEGFSQTLDTAGPIFEQLGNAFERLGSALGMTSVDVKGNQTAWNDMKSTGAQVGAVLGGVATFMAQLVTNAVNFATGVARIWSRMSEPFSRLWTSFGQVFSAIGMLMSALFASGAATDDTASDWVSMGERIGGAVAGVAGVVAGLISGIAGLVRGLAAIVEGAIDVIVGVLTLDGAKAWGGFKKIALGAISGIIDAVWGLIEAVTSAVDALGAVGGKDLGFGAAARAYRDKMQPGIEPDLEAKKVGGPRPIGPPVAADWGMPTSLVEQANSATKGMTNDPATLAALAKSKQPMNVTVPVTLQVGDDVVARLTAKANMSEAGRDFNMSTPQQ